MDEERQKTTDRGMGETDKERARTQKMKARGGGGEGSGSTWARREGTRDRRARRARRTSSSSCSCGFTEHTYNWRDFNANTLEGTGILKTSLNTSGAWKSTALEQ